MSSHLLVSFHISLTSVLQLSMYQFLISLVKFIPKQFIIFNVTVNAIAFKFLFHLAHCLCIEMQQIFCMLALYPATFLNSLLLLIVLCVCVGGIFRVFYI